MFVSFGTDYLDLVIFWKSINMFFPNKCEYTSSRRCVPSLATDL
jgi:hypothetical protein